MSTTSCTPVAVDGWGGAGDGCVTVAGAADLLDAVEDTLRAAYPERWQASAADEYAARLTDLLHHTHLLAALIETARLRAAELAAVVAAAWEDR